MLFIFIGIQVSYGAPRYRITDLGTLGGNYSRARAINNHGQITGSSRNSEGNENAFIWDRDNGMVSLGNDTYIGFDINDSGYVVGHELGEDLCNDVQAFFWNKKDEVN